MPKSTLCSVHYGCTNGRRVPHYQVWSSCAVTPSSHQWSHRNIHSHRPDNHYPTIPTIIILSLPIIAIIISQSSHSSNDIGKKGVFHLWSLRNPLSLDLSHGLTPFCDGLNLLIFIFVYLFLSKWVFVYLCSLYFPWTDTISWRSPLTEGWPHSSLMIH